MRTLLQALSWITLAATLAPAVLYFGGSVDLATMQAWMLAASVAWFVVTPLWMER